MLQTIFSLRGCEYRSNRIPESFDQLQEAATKIIAVHSSREQGLAQFAAQNHKEVPAKLRFTYVSSQSAEEKELEDD